VDYPQSVLPRFFHREDSYSDFRFELRIHRPSGGEHQSLPPPNDLAVFFGEPKEVPFFGWHMANQIENLSKPPFTSATSDKMWPLP